MINVITGILLLTMNLTFNNVQASDDYSLSSSKKKSLVAILSLNDMLFTNFLKDDQQSVETSALELKKAISLASGRLGGLKNKVLNLSKIKKNNSKELNLLAYSEFLPTLVELVKKHKPDVEYEIYYCPMIKKNWIQDRRTNSMVKNVFAQEMLECGEKS